MTTQKYIRYEIEGDPTSIAYGFDPTSGIFLSVYDKRLMYNENETKEVNKATETIGTGDGAGYYFDLHTGKHGFGMKVSSDTMRVYLQRYGVPDKNIEALISKLF